MTMGHRIAVLNGGRLQQLGTPLELYQWPANLFVAKFIGSPPMNLLPVKVCWGERHWPSLPPGRSRPIALGHGCSHAMNTRRTWPHEYLSTRGASARASSQDARAGSGGAGDRCGLGAAPPGS